MLAERSTANTRWATIPQPIAWRAAVRRPFTMPQISVHRRNQQGVRGGGSGAPQRLDDYSRIQSKFAPSAGFWSCCYTQFAPKCTKICHFQAKKNKNSRSPDRTPSITYTWMWNYADKCTRAAIILANPTCLPRRRTLKGLKMIDILFKFETCSNCTRNNSYQRWTSFYV